jgi:hypothetical protein
MSDVSARRAVSGRAGTFGHQVTDTKLDVWVTEAGVPVDAQLDADLTALILLVGPVTVHATYAMSDVGGPIVITAPVVSPEPSRSKTP